MLAMACNWIERSWLLQRGAVSLGKALHQYVHTLNPGVGTWLNGDCLCGWIVSSTVMTAGAVCWSWTEQVVQPGKKQHPWMACQIRGTTQVLTIIIIGMMGTEHCNSHFCLWCEVLPPFTDSGKQFTWECLLVQERCTAAANGTASAAAWAWPLQLCSAALQASCLCQTLNTIYYIALPSAHLPLASHWYQYSWNCADASDLPREALHPSFWILSTYS